MNQELLTTRMDPGGARRTRRRRWIAWATVAGLSALSLGAASVQQDASQNGAPAPSLKETRLVMGKWIETQQIISKERNEWQQGKEVLVSRIELLRKEVSTLHDKINEAEHNLTESNAKREQMLSQENDLKATSEQLTTVVSQMEREVLRLFKTLPDPIQAKLQPLHQRIPEPEKPTKVSIAERFQNVLGIMNELNKASSELTVNYEVRDLADGKPAEVRALYVGLTQAYYISAQGEAGIGRPSPEGWKWEPSKAIANDVLMALEIAQGKQSPAFVPLPVKLP